MQAGSYYFFLCAILYFMHIESRLIARSYYLCGAKCISICIVQWWKKRVQNQPWISEFMLGDRPFNSALPLLAISHSQSNACNQQQKTIREGSTRFVALYRECLHCVLICIYMYIYTTRMKKGKRYGKLLNYLCNIVVLMCAGEILLYARKAGRERWKVANVDICRIEP